MLSKRILVIGNDQMSFQPILKFTQNFNADISCAMSVKEGLNLLLSSEYCLVIMCISSPINNDAEFLRLIRETHPIPIVVVAPKLEVSEKVTLFHAGANACLEQPVDTTLCIAQAQSLIQLYLDAKIADNKEHPLVFGAELIINPIYRHIIINGEPLDLTRTEFDLLFCMAKHPNQIFSRQQLYQQIWGDDLGISGENTVRSHIGNLYKKLADAGQNYIQNIRGIGYKFVPPTSKE